MIEQTLEKPRRPVCRYHGGKWKLADWVISHFPPHRFYVEPFGGAGSVLLKKSRSKCEIYNDLDGEVVNYFRVLRDEDQARCLTAQLELTPFARDEFNFAYFGPATDDPVERARRFFVRMSHGWGTKMQSPRRAFRSRRGLSEATPAADFVNYPKHIKSFTNRLRGVVVENKNALEVIKIYDDPGVLFYCDPPYLISTRSNKGAGTYKHELTDENHIHLAELLWKTKGLVVISGYPSELYEELYTKQGWIKKTKAHHAEMARPSTECLWISPRTAEALEHVLFRPGGIG